ncbi:PAS domain S-box protein [Modicisalibacter luteus]|uniref:PAS domain S-box protein n=1 Tax=Modicisalibacter luteus TaxID=453962 RepID=A0ABV7M210_9GAMM|nr:PAS domain S-box protein [Halomonas lutea]
MKMDTSGFDVFKHSFCRPSSLKFKGAQRIKGYLPEEIVGQHFSRLCTEEDRAKGEPERGLTIARTTGRFEKEGYRQRKDGSLFIAYVVIDAIYSDDGTLLGFAKITRDITESRQTQQAMEQAREALFQSQKMEPLGQLTGGIAHDFNRLLMVFLEACTSPPGTYATTLKLRACWNAIQRGPALGFADTAYTGFSS